ncbi:MAG: arylsulfatase A-like enzyme [Planctomycetota bacterium]|jgi:arylsulfatase A-like enzyme
MNFRFRYPHARNSSFAFALFLCACGDGQTPTSSQANQASDRPNILWVVWDTVRADHLSLYGYERETTPQLDSWAKEAMVFENCLSTAPITVSSHAAMFTGLMPTETGASNAHQWLNDGFETMAEQMSGAGYRTFAWAANPHISKEENFTQGFETIEHPWDSAVRKEARAIVSEKVTGDRSNELGKRLRKEDVDGWTLKAAGELAEPALNKWLAAGDQTRPFFAFVNYMEAHRPLIPPRKLREKFMSPKDVDRSYQVDVSWIPMWAFNFGLSEISERDLEAIEAVYDASILELDGLFASLLASLDEAGELENTIVVLTSDHGEHLGDHHMLDHQFSVFDSLLEVPLIVHFPAKFKAGRDARPVVNYDLHPTLLELAGLQTPVDSEWGPRSLLRPADQRLRLAEFNAPFTKPFRALRKSYPDWDQAEWEQSLRALSNEQFKLIQGSAGRRELFVVGDESRDLITEETEALDSLERALDVWVNRLKPAKQDTIPETTDAHREMLDGLGYSGEDEQ